MKKKWTAKKREYIGSVNLLCLLFLPLLVSGCSSHDNRFSYFNMLDSKKTTVQNKKAAEKFWSSVRPVSTLSASHYKLGRYYQQQNKYDKAIKEFSKALRDDSKYCKAYNGIAMSHDALNRCDMAYNSYEQAIQCDPQEAYAYNNYACSSMICGDYEKGLALLLKAAQLSADNNRIKNNIKLVQMLVDRKNNLAKEVPPQKATVTVTATTGLKPTENEGEKALTDPTEEKAGSFTPETTPGENITDRVDSESAEKNSAASPAKVNDVADQKSNMEKAGEVVSLPTADAGVISKEEGNELFTPETTLGEDVTDRIDSESAEKNSAASPAKVNDVADQKPDMEKAVEVMSIPTADAGVVSREEDNKLESSLPDNIAIASLIVVEDAKKLRSLQEDDPGPALNYLKSTAIEVSNGNGIAGMASRSADYLRSYGFTVGRITNAKYFNFNESIIFYREGYLQVAEELARLAPGVQDIEKVDSLGRPSIGVRILLGRDLVNTQFPDGYARNLTSMEKVDQKADHISSTSNMANLAVTY